MKVLCLCRRAICDQADNLPYKAYYYPDEGYDVWLEKLIDLVETLVEERESGKEWTVLGRPLSAVYPSGGEVSGYIADNIIGRLVGTERKMFECEVCGRRWLRIVGAMQPETQEYVSFLPETNARGVLGAQGAHVAPDQQP
jgi:hypothetical protein